jgi:hypothetical protein
MLNLFFGLKSNDREFVFRILALDLKVDDDDDDEGDEVEEIGFY